MKHIKIFLLILLGFLGVWLLYWDFSDFLTQGLNTGIWDFSIVINAFPSIAMGFCIILVVSVLGIHVIKG